MTISKVQRMIRIFPRMNIAEKNTNNQDLFRRMNIAEKIIGFTLIFNNNNVFHNYLFYNRKYFVKNAILDGCSTVDSKLDYDGIGWYSMVLHGIRWYCRLLHGI